MYMLKNMHIYRTKSGYIKIKKQLFLQNAHSKTPLVGGFNPVEKYESNWESSPNNGKNKTYLKPPPRHLKIPQLLRTSSPCAFRPPNGDTTEPSKAKASLPGRTGYPRWRPYNRGHYRTPPPKKCTLLHGKSSLKFLPNTFAALFDEPPQRGNFSWSLPY